MVHFAWPVPQLKRVETRARSSHPLLWNQIWQPRYFLNTLKNCCTSLTTKLFGGKICNTVHHEPSVVTIPHLTPNNYDEVEIGAFMQLYRQESIADDTSLTLDNIKNFLWRNLQQGTVMKTSVKFQRDSTHSSWIKAHWKFFVIEGCPSLCGTCYCRDLGCNCVIYNADKACMPAALWVCAFCSDFWFAVWAPSHASLPVYTFLQTNIKKMFIWVLPKAGNKQLSLPTVLSTHHPQTLKS